MNHLRGSSGGRLGGRKVLIGFGIAFPLFLAITAAIATLAAPGTHAPCAPFRPCGPPSSSPFVDLQVWRSSQYGFALAYPADKVSIAHQDAGSLELLLKDGSGMLIVKGSPASQTSPSGAVSSEFSTLAGSFNGLTSDSRPEARILGANVGLLRSGPWGAYVGTFAGPIAPNQTTTVAIQAASDGKVIITTAALDFSDKSYASFAYFLASSVFDTVQWAS